MSPFLILAIGIAVVVGGILFLRLHAFLALVLGALVVSFITPAGRLQKAAPEEAKVTIGERVGRGFGSTAGQIGIMIAMASIIGQCLLESGGAERIVRSSLRLFGERSAPIVFAATGFLLGIPVFFDTVFYLMIPLGKAMAARTGKNYALYVMTIAAGATISHSLVPPTPGPLYVATELKVLGEMIVAGILIGGLSVIPGAAYAYWSNRRWPIPLRDTAGVSLEELRAISDRDERTLPPLWLALLTILLPVVLIVNDVTLPMLAKSIPIAKGVLSLSKTLGNANVALGIAAAIALVMQIRYRTDPKTKLSISLETALASAGQVILITAAGGAFGTALQQTGIAQEIKALFPPENVGMVALPAAFFVTALVRAAQGSATVAMVTAIGMFAGMATQLGCHPVYLALAVGFGSKPLPWMNDSGFWVVCRMSGQTVGETLRNHTVVFTIMGFTGLALTMIAARFFPLVQA